MLKQIKSSSLYDYIMVTLCFWFMSGLILDGWAHNHSVVSDTFFTPYHFVFYSGFFQIVLFFSTAIILNMKHGFSFKHAFPPGYILTFYGIILMTIGGISDMTWHLLFGIEQDIAALLSPSHVLILLGGGLIFLGPINSIWIHTQTSSNFKLQLPLIINAALIITLFNFMTHYINPLVGPFSALNHKEAGPYYGYAIGLSGTLLQTIIMFGFVLFFLIRGKLLPGSLTIIFTLNSVAMSFMRDHYEFILPMIIAGIIGDLLLYLLKPSAKNILGYRLFAFFAPVTYWGCYYLSIVMISGTWWSIHVFTGIIFEVGIAGLLLSYLIISGDINSINKKTH